MPKQARPGEPPHRTIQERIAAFAERLSPSERRVARYLAEHAEEIVSHSAAKIATALRVSDATVVRTAKALGYTGLPELKRELWYSTRAVGALRLGRRLDHLGSDDALVNEVIDGQIRAFEEARESLRPEALHQAIDLLHKAKRIVSLSIHYGPLADYLTQTLRRHGHQTRSITARGSNVAEGLMELASGDVLVVIGSDVHVREIEVAVAHASRRGVPCLLITDGEQASGGFAIVLSTRRQRSDEIPKAGPLLLVAEILALGLAGRDRRASINAMEALGELRDEVDHWPRTKS